jgi:GNAT superfamily N-acetyltransferase
MEYDQIDPLSALHISMLALNFTFTPERAAQIRKNDPRPFPCFALYAVEDGSVLGQVGVFRLPMISTQGREDVGGVWAVSTHPEHGGRGVATRLLAEAHTRMLAAGLRFSTLYTNRYLKAHRLYRRLGYEDTDVWATGMARHETAQQPTGLSARPPGPEGHGFVEDLFAILAEGYLGFAWRHTPFAEIRNLDLKDILILWQDQQPVGYALTRLEKDVLIIRDLAHLADIDTAAAVAAVAAHIKSDYVQVTVSRPRAVKSLKNAGFQVAHPNWTAFMIKPLTPDLTLDDARSLFAIGTDNFLISPLDVT